MHQLIGDHGQNKGVKQLLQGPSDINTITSKEYECQLLKELQYIKVYHLIPPFETEVTYEEFAKLFNNTKEIKSSSPSGLNIGHYKVDALYPDIVKSLVTMMSLPFMYVFSPKRWKQSIHFMIEKKGQPRLEKLCIIQILEDDFNAVLKIKIGRMIMKT